MLSFIYQTYKSKVIMLYLYTESFMLKTKTPNLQSFNIIVFA